MPARRTLLLFHAISVVVLPPPAPHDGDDASLTEYAQPLPLLHVAQPGTPQRALATQTARTTTTTKTTTKAVCTHARDHGETAAPFRSSVMVGAAATVQCDAGCARGGTVVAEHAPPPMEASHTNAP
jgi:hypothetical protein